MGTQKETHPNSGPGTSSGHWEGGGTSAGGRGEHFPSSVHPPLRPRPDVLQELRQSAGDTATGGEESTPTPEVEVEVEVSISRPHSACILRSLSLQIVESAEDARKGPTREGHSHEASVPMEVSIICIRTPRCRRLQTHSVRLHFTQVTK